LGLSRKCRQREEGKGQGRCHQNPVHSQPPPGWIWVKIAYVSGAFNDKTSLPQATSEIEISILIPRMDLQLTAVRRVPILKKRAIL
jgi:hypothetical protein